MMPLRVARASALRVAKIACGLTVTACAPVASGADAFSEDVSAHDAGADAPLVFYEGDAFVDAHFPGDAACTELVPTDRLCCLLGGGEWYEYDGGFAECFVGVPGPFMPPVDRGES